MSSTVSPSSDRAAPLQASSKVSDKGILHIEVCAESPEDVEGELVPFAGCIPEDTPFWKGCPDWDVRGFPRWTAQYASDAAAISPDDRDLVRSAIWRRLEQLLPNGKAKHLLPSIIFQDSLLRNHLRQGIIDLVFDCKEGFQAFCDVHKDLDVLHIYGSDKKSYQYLFQACTNSLSGRIMIFECVGLQIEASDSRFLFKALEDVMCPAGVLLGFGKVVTKSKQYGIKDDGIIRGYVQLHHENLIPRLIFLARILPKHIRWDGVAYALHYAGRRYHSRDVISRNYTSSGQAETEAWSDKKRKESELGGNAESSKGAKRKRRSE